MAPEIAGATTSIAISTGRPPLWCDRQGSLVVPLDGLVGAGAAVGLERVRSGAAEAGAALERSARGDALGDGALAQRRDELLAGQLALHQVEGLLESLHGAVDLVLDV